jgi:hypothetical protein
MLFLEEPDRIAPNWRKSNVVWRLTVSRLKDGLGWLIDSGRGDSVENHTVLNHNVPKPRRDILVRHDCLGHAIDVTNAFFGRSIDMMFTLGHDNMLNAVNKEEVIKLFAADLTAEVREQSLGVTVNTRDKLDISSLCACLFAMRDKQLGTSPATDKKAVVPIATA